MKKLIPLLLALCMLASCMPAHAQEAPMTITWYSYRTPLEDGSWGELTFEERFGVDVQIVRAESDDEFAALLGSGAIPDFMVLDSASVVANMVDLGIVVPFTEEMLKENMPRYYAMCTAVDPNFFNYGAIDGQLYGLPRNNANADAAYAGAIRADWLEALNLAVPTTVEELSNVFYQFTYGDPDGNGIQDTYALTAGGLDAAGEGGYNTFFSTIFSIYGVNPYYWTKDSDGNLVYGFVTEGSRKALTLLQDWYSQGLIDPEFVTTDHRSNGTDVALKFANGTVGYVDGLIYTDYEWDNDGHVNAKWVANTPEWQEFFASTTDENVLYQFGVTTDFDPDGLGSIGPYYINLNPIADEEGNVHGYVRSEQSNRYFCFGANCSEEKMIKIMQILEMEAMDEETYCLHFGPEGVQWMYAENGDKVFNPNYTEHEFYHPQGRILGYGYCLYLMYQSNPDLLMALKGERYVQRFDKTKVVFDAFDSFGNMCAAALPSSAEYSELTSTFVSTNIVNIIRGDISMDQWDDIVQQWYKNGGEQLTKDANEWYAAFSQ